MGDIYRTKRMKEYIYNTKERLCVCVYDDLGVEERVELRLVESNRIEPNQVIIKLHDISNIILMVTLENLN